MQFFFKLQVLQRGETGMRDLIKNLKTAGKMFLNRMVRVFKLMYLLPNGRENDQGMNGL